ncbi:PAS/PAC sensor hybrid histidine kinase [Minicystis rosea]|nr:PAS/PAC sensor hybrid histidine kinase [Minicystis rosea]
MESTAPKKGPPAEDHGDERSSEEASDRVRPVDDGDAHVLDDLERLTREIARVEPGAESSLMRLLLARVTIDNTCEFCGLLDTRGIMWEANRTSVRGAGIRRSDVHGVPFWETRWWSGTGGEAELREAIARAARGEMVRYDAEVIGGGSGREGEKITIDFNLSPIRDRHGKVVFMTAEGRDVTEQRRLEREVERQQEELRRNDRLKSEFFADISHELRTPLTLLLGPLEDLLGNRTAPLPPEQRWQVEMAHRSALRLLKLANTFLDFTRIEAGHAQARRERTDLARLTTDLAELFRVAVERAGLSLVIDVEPLGRDYFLDREMWEKIVFNLLSNALKFTFEGSITVRVRRAGESARLEIADTGTGIEAHELPHVFDRFRRVRGARSRTHEGTGIGLALVQELTKLHHGRVEIASTFGRGTTMTVTIPPGEGPEVPSGVTMGTRLTSAHFAEEALRWTPAPPHVEHKRTKDRPRVLVADDNADMREYIARLLEPQYEVILVSDGRSALETVRTTHPDLVLSDVMMPGLDGLELLRRIRADMGIRHTPVVLLSARAGEEASVEGLESGADDYLVKPFSARELLARVRTHLTLARTRTNLETAREAIRMRDEFLEIAGHELRTPLTSFKLEVQNMAHHARRNLPGSVLGERLEKAEARIGRLSRLVEELLDAARMGSEGIALAPEVHDLAHIAREVVDRFAERALREGCDLLVSAPRPVTARVDRGRFEQVLDNLLENAIKFGRKKPVEVRVRRDRARAIVEVVDHGVGIEASARDRIFERFERAVPKQRFGGLGLGLWIAKQIVAASGGTIRVESEPDVETIFTVDLPAMSAG